MACVCLCVSMCVCVSLSVVSESLTLWTVVLASLGPWVLFRQEYWSGYTFPSQEGYLSARDWSSLLNCRQILHCLDIRETHIHTHVLTHIHSFQIPFPYRLL